MRTRHVAQALLAAAFLMASAGSTGAVAPKGVKGCTSEAAMGYGRVLRTEPSLPPAVVSHRKRMSETCTAFLAGRTDTTAALTRCLREASVRPVRAVQAQRADPGLVTRQKTACRAAGGER